jgi:hypothetical protein
VGYGCGSSNVEALKHGANIQKNNKGETSFQVAVARGEQKIIQLLSEYMQNDHRIWLVSPFTKGCHGCHLDVLAGSNIYMTCKSLARTPHKKGVSLSTRGSEQIIGLQVVSNARTLVNVSQLSN